MASQQLLGRFRVASTNNTVAVDNGTSAQSIALSMGLRYLRGYTGEGTDQLCEDLQTKVRNSHGSYASFTCTYSDASGRVTLNFDGPTTTVTWTDAALATLFGFTGNLSGDDNYTGTQQPAYVWRPTRSASDYPLTLENAMMPTSTTRLARSKNGTLSSLQGSLLYYALLSWQALPEADVIKPSSGTVYRDLETFWSLVMHAGERVRYQPDRTSWASTGVHECLAFTKGGDEDAEVGAFGDYASRHVSSFNGLYDVTLELHKVI